MGWQDAPVVGAAPPQTDAASPSLGGSWSDAPEAPAAPSWLNAAVRGIGNAIPFSNDIAALGDTATSYLPQSVKSYIPGINEQDQSGEAFSQRFSENKTRQEALDAAAQKAYPVTSFVAPLAGAAAALPVAGPVDAISAGITRLAPRVAGLAADSLASGTVGAGYGAAYGAGSGTDLGDRLSNAATGATLGGVGGAAAPIVAKGIVGTAKAAGDLAKGFINPEARGADIAADQIAKDQASGAGVLMTPKETGTVGSPGYKPGIDVAQDAGQPVAAADLGGQGTRRLARAISNQSPEAQATLADATNARFLSQNTRLPDFVQDMYGANMNDPAKIQAALDANKAATNPPAYRQAYKDGENGIWSPDLEAMVQSPAVQDAIKGATRIGQNDAVLNKMPVVRNPFVADASGNMVLKTDPDGSQAIPALQFWDYVKRGLDTQIGAAKKANDNTGVAQLTGLKNQLLGTLDDATRDPTTGISSYQTARQGAFHLFGADNALDAGRNILNPNLTPAQVQATVDGLKSPLQANALSYGAATAVVQKAANTGDSRNIVGLFNTPAIRQKLQAAMGPDKATALEAWLRSEGAQTVLKNAIGGNSSTAEQAGDLIGMAAKSFSGPVAGATLGAAEAYREEGFDPELMMKYGALGFMGGALRKYVSGVNEKVTQSIAENLASRDPKVINAAIARISKNPKLMNGWRAITNQIVGLPAVATRPQPQQQQLPAPTYAAGGRVTVDAEPTEAQKAVGNYKKGHIRIHGLDVTIENPKGSDRTGISDGKQWRVKMPHHYGYIRGTTGADGDHVDCYVGPREDSDRVFVIDQKDLKTGKFDEHKIMLGFANKGAAIGGYCGGFSDGKGYSRIMKTTPMSVDEFKEWLRGGNMRKPLARSA